MRLNDHPATRRTRPFTRRTSNVAKTRFHPPAPAPRTPGRPPLPLVPAGRHLDDPTRCRHPGSAERGLRPAPPELRGQPGPDRPPRQLPVPRRRLLAVPDPHRGRALAEAGRHEQRRRHEGGRGQPRVPPRRPRQAGRREQLPHRQRPVAVAHRRPQLRRGRVPGRLPRHRPGLPRQPEAARVRLRGRPRRRPARDPAGLRRRSGKSLDAQGNLVLHTSGGDLVEHAPVAYQESTASGTASPAGSC